MASQPPIPEVPEQAPVDAPVPTPQDPIIPVPSDPVTTPAPAGNPLTEGP